MITEKRKYSKSISQIIDLYNNGVLNEAEMKQLLSTSLAGYVDFRLDNYSDKLYKYIEKGILRSS